jgi:sec-independent protein translocase protein TatA
VRVLDGRQEGLRMPNLGGPELIILLVVVVLLFGAKKLPELGSSVGKSIKNFKRGIEDATAEDDEPDKRATADDESVNTPK